MAKDRMLKPIGFSNRGNVERIPEFPRKTPLQKTIQLLKRHRDVMFQNNQDVAPASIIITTIAAKLYDHETDYVGLFEKIIKHFAQQIENRSGVYWVANPVNTAENFADRWISDPKKREAFFEWLHKVNADFSELLSSKTSKELLSKLYSMFGQKVVDLSNNNLGGFDAIVPSSLNEQALPVPYSVQQALNVSHRQKAPWRLPSWSVVKIQATVGSGYLSKSISSGELLDKGLGLTFKAVHNVQPPYTVKWQVTNTGKEASINHCMRGDFYNSDPENKNIRTEATSYSGIHYVQCFVIKRGSCVAKSKEFIVNIC